jgi:hypothetical protein
LAYGKKLEWFLQLEAEGHHVERLDNKPSLYDDLVLDYKAFIALNNSRPAGLSPSSIPLTEILAYMRIFEINDYDQRLEFLKNIRILDAVYLNFIKDQDND